MSKETRETIKKTRKKTNRKIKITTKERERERDRERESEKREGNKKLGNHKGRHWKLNKKCLFLGGNRFFGVLKTKRNTKKTKQKKQGGLRAKWDGPSGHLTWPLNLKKNHKKNKKYQKWAFQLSGKLFCFYFGGVPNFPFLTTWQKKNAHPKNTIKNRGFSKPFFDKNIVSWNGHFEQKTNPEIPIIIFLFFSPFDKKHKTLLLNPLFYSV